MNDNRFSTFEEAKTWALRSPQNVFTRSADGNGFVPKAPAPETKQFPSSASPRSRQIRNLELYPQVDKHRAESIIGSADMRELEKILRPGDELWQFCSSAESWEYLAGQSGLSVVRDDEIVYQVIVMMS